MSESRPTQPPKGEALGQSALQRALARSRIPMRIVFYRFLSRLKNAPKRTSQLPPLSCGAPPLLVGVCLPLLVILELLALAGLSNWPQIHVEKNPSIEFYV